MIEKAHRFALPAVIAVIAVSGCGTTSQAEEEADKKCPSFSAMANGECSSVQAAEQAKHKEQVESEAHEAEAVIKHRAAEETANQIEGAAGK